MKKIYSIINYSTKEKYAGHRGREYSDLDIARFWALKKSIDFKATIALYAGDRMLNLYRDGEPIKESEA